MSTQAIENVEWVDEPGPDTQATRKMHSLNSPGGGDSYVLPAASASEIGGVKLATSVAAVASADAAAATGDAPTKAEFDAVVTLANELKTKLNSVLANVKSAGQMAS